jgi:hypothetical protein
MDKVQQLQTELLEVYDDVTLQLLVCRHLMGKQVSPVSMIRTLSSSGDYLHMKFKNMYNDVWRGAHSIRKPSKDTSPLKNLDRLNQLISWGTELYLEIRKLNLKLYRE